MFADRTASATVVACRELDTIENSARNANTRIEIGKPVSNSADGRADLCAVEHQDNRRPENTSEVSARAITATVSAVEQSHGAFNDRDIRLLACTRKR
jgi:hypothetical protein